MFKEEGLEGVIAGKTAISTVGQEGVGLTYRGYTIEELTRYAAFEEVVHLLVEGQLPNEKTLKIFQDKLQASQSLPHLVLLILEKTPKTSNAMDMLRTVVSLLGMLEPETENYNILQISNRLIPFCISALLYWYNFHNFNQAINFVTGSKTLAHHFLTLLYNREPSKEEEEALNSSFILYAEHEFNASTFAARVTTSTLSDYYSAIVSAIGTLRGPLHGGANEEALLLINQFTTVNEVEKKIKTLLENKALLMGFGHRVYKKTDPRSTVAKKIAKNLIKSPEQALKFSIAEKIEEVVFKEKNLYPNLDFYSALIYDFLKIPADFFTPLFLIARISGWSAHVVEQRNHNRLIRPLARYIGPELRTYIPLNSRK